MSTLPLSNETVHYPQGKHPNSLKNLIPFVKGWRGNPDPPEKGFQITRRLRRMLEEHSDFIPPNANPNDKVYAEQIARQILIKSAQGDAPMTNILLDRTEGKIPGDVPQVQNINVVFVVGKGYQTPGQIANPRLKEISAEDY